MYQRRESLELEGFDYDSVLPRLRSRKDRKGIVSCDTEQGQLTVILPKQKLRDALNADEPRAFGEKRSMTRPGPIRAAAAARGRLLSRFLHFETPSWKAPCLPYSISKALKWEIAQQIPNR